VQWAALHHLMEYLAAHPSFKIQYRMGTKLIDLFSEHADTDWGNSLSRRSTAGMVMLYNKSPIMWKSKMQKTTALSTMEAEYYSALAAGCEVLYLQALLDRLGFKQKRPTQIYEDNTACIEWGNNVIGGRERTKHIDIQKHLLRCPPVCGFVSLLVQDSSGWPGPALSDVGAEYVSVLPVSCKFLSGSRRHTVIPVLFGWPCAFDAGPLWY
jgi:hypothetical protein